MVYESFLCLCTAIATRVCFVTPSFMLLACALVVTPAGIPWFHNDVTHLVVVDSLKQPLASKSDRRPVGTLQCNYNTMVQPLVIVTISLL
jgi:hypothetical protein